ncbi:hypothetical protein OIE78_35155 (plasmid) [Streptomyces cellulosae]|uniref:hypothetical protein n=1 Tax=Streptomyces cellulosae TaxID=1968 RepID=UPI002F90D5D2|nr:hypothetical protein OG837_35065 [Streptomyces cellulosae]
MSDQNTPDFPEDLLKARRELHEVHGQLHTMQAARPWSVEPSDGWDDSDSGRWYPSVKPATEGWSSEDTEAYAALLERARDLSTFVITHTFWSTIAAEERSDARSKLIQVTRPAPADSTPAP